MKPINPSELFDTLVAVASGAVAENGDVDAASGAAATQTLDILLVEDSLYNQRLAQGVLSKMGHRVTVAETGTQAVEAHRRRRFDLILMDVQMPEMDGLEATRRIRAREAGSGDRVPIIAMTAQALKGDRERCLESGMDDYLAKPVRAAELRAKIQEVAGAEATRTLPASGSLDACDPAHPSRAGSLRGVMHSFSGDSQTARACLELGLHISFAGMLTYKKNDDLRRTAGAVPLDRLLVETDSPYLTPVPLRGKMKRNEPANVVHTAACLAEIHCLGPEKLAETTTANANALFGLNRVRTAG
jgi:CheY-like chemotaxis protein